MVMKFLEILILHLSRLKDYFLILLLKRWKREKLREANIKVASTQLLITSVIKVDLLIHLTSIATLDQL